MTTRRRPVTQKGESAVGNVKRSSVRRLVTGHDAHGRSVIASDGPPDRVYRDLGEDGLVFFELWSTREMPARIDRVDAEPFEERLMLAPPPNGVRIRILDVPPISISVPSSWRTRADELAVSMIAMQGNMQRLMQGG